jgi:WD40 repeat protein
MKKIYLKNKKIWLLLSLIMLCFAVGMLLFFRLNSIYAPVSLPVQIRLPFDANGLLQEINISNAKNLQELHVFSEHGNTPVLKLSFSVDGCCVLAIHTDGLLEKWQVRPEKLVAQYQLGKTHSRAVSFSADGSRLVTPRQVLDDGKILGANVWNPSTGKSIFCEGSHPECPGSHSWEAEDGLVLDSNGKWLLGYGLMVTEEPGYARTQSPTYDWQMIEDSSEPTETGLLPLDKIYIEDPNTQIAMATSVSPYFAFAFANGLVSVQTIEASYSFPLYYTDGVKKTRVNVVDLAMDDTRTWLAELCDDELLVWNIQRWVRPLAMRVPAPKATALAFDHTGQILAVATDTEIRFYDLNWGTVAGNISTQGTSTLTFGRDNRMLISGDSIGNVHTWGIP